MKKATHLSEILFVLIVFLFSACTDPTGRQNQKSPNILWIYVEDINTFMSCYGVDINPTPHIDRLAENGTLFENAFTPSPVCSPTRSGIITGTIPTTFGLHNHHSSRTVESAIFLPEGVKTIPELFRDAGYYTFNHGKDDYNFVYDRSRLYSGTHESHFWYTWQGTGSWRDEERGEDQPWFGQIQLEGGKYVIAVEKIQKVYRETIPPEQRMDPALPEIPPYYPNIPEIREDWAMHYDAIKMVDLDVMGILEELERDGELENTVIFFFSDHGYKGIRHKQFCYDGGLKVPLIVAHFGKDGLILKSLRRMDLASLIDLGPTSLGLAGIQIPDYMEGMDLFAPDFKRDHIIATRDRCDFTIDRIRAVRTERFKYIRNYMPQRSYQQATYRDRRVEYTAIRDLFEKEELNEVQAKYWLPYKPEEELFDLEADPHEIHNLADDPVYASELDRHRKILEQWIKKTDDKGQYPEEIPGLRFMLERWGERCINPEFEAVRAHPVAGAPNVALKSSDLIDK